MNQARDFRVRLLVERVIIAHWMIWEHHGPQRHELAEDGIISGIGPVNPTEDVWPEQSFSTSEMGAILTFGFGNATRDSRHAHRHGRASKAGEDVVDKFVPALHSTADLVKGDEVRDDLANETPEHKRI